MIRESSTINLAPELAATRKEIKSAGQSGTYKQFVKVKATPPSLTETLPRPNTAIEPPIPPRLSVTGSKVANTERSRNT
ncbi:hypothetical protein WICPIJ_006876 [Wickerhamomyces pijperi]|uniref:Uncharacterized protein n=1 Tax=Wickerhamomyces pijperi TaxID=599730 RepID=A0A9P8TJS9_WICPI|nr:hypothetical protein WICPIJ_006876 [Wickerhamomyces pijperi]